MAKTKIAAASIEAFLRQLPGPMYSMVSPQQVLRDAHDLYSATCGDPVELNEFTDHLHGRGIRPDQVGNRYWLKLPGRSREFKQIVDTATRISG